MTDLPSPTAVGSDRLRDDRDFRTYRQQLTPKPLMSRVNTTGRMPSFGSAVP